MNLRFKTLPEDELLEVICLPKSKSKKLLIGAAIDRDSLVFIRGDFSASIVQIQGLCLPSSVKLDRLRLADFGQTICFGKYEVDVGVVLKEVKRCACGKRGKWIADGICRYGYYCKACSEKALENA